MGKAVQKLVDPFHVWTDQPNKPEKPKPPPPPPEVPEKEAKLSEEELAKREQQRKGRISTVLTTSRGDVSTAPTRRKTLLGQ